MPLCDVAEFISPKEVYTFSSIGDSRIPNGVKCTGAAAKCEVTVDDPTFGFRV